MQHTSKGSRADRAFTDVLMPVKLRAHCRLGIIAVPHAHCIEADRPAHQLHRLRIPFLRHDVVSSNVQMACIEAHRDRRTLPQTLDKLGDLFELRAKRKLRSCRVLHQDAKRRSASEVDALGRLDDRLSGQPETFFTRQAFPASGMQHQVFRSQRKRPLHLAAKALDGHRPHSLSLRAQIDQVTCVDRNGTHVMLRAHLAHLRSVRRLDRVHAPHPRARGEELEGVGAGLHRALDRRPASACGPHVYPDALLCAACR